MATTEITPGAGGQVYGELVREQVDAQDRYKESIEGRAMSVITSSSTIAALLFAFTAFLNGGETQIEVPALATAALTASLVMFVFAAGAALYVNAPRNYEGPVADALQELLNEAWTTGEPTQSAAHRVASARVNMLRTAKTQNGLKANALSWAIGFEFGAISGLAVAVIAALQRW